MPPPPSRDEIVAWLRETDPERLRSLHRHADGIRAHHVGPAVHLRGLVEWSNHCARACHYCGLRAGRPLPFTRYRMRDDEILDAAHRAVRQGYGSLVLQAGEDDGLDVDRVAGVVRRIKAETPLAVTLSLGERRDDETARWREAGADRYLLRFETSDPGLYALLHPLRVDRPGQASDRPAQLRRLRAQGYEIGGGFMVGLPGQRVETLADDLLLCRALDLDMIGIGPWLPDPSTPLGALWTAPPSSAVFSRTAAQYPALARAVADARADPSRPRPDATTTLTVLSLARWLCPEANIPSTTALGVSSGTGRMDGLACGGNVVMPNLTPSPYRDWYAIYPEKSAGTETAEGMEAAWASSLAERGRTWGRGPGGRHRSNHAPAEPGYALPDDTL